MTEMLQAVSTLVLLVAMVATVALLARLVHIVVRFERHMSSRLDDADRMKKGGESDG